MGPMNELDHLGATPHPVDNITVAGIDEKATAGSTIDVNNAADLNPDKELPDQDAQRGVQQAEAINIIWSKTTMRVVFVS
jgi:hypothetical protein